MILHGRNNYFYCHNGVSGLNAVDSCACNWFAFVSKICYYKMSSDVEKTKELKNLLSELKNALKMKSGDPNGRTYQSKLS